MLFKYEEGSHLRFKPLLIAADVFRLLMVLLLVAQPFVRGPEMRFFALFGLLTCLPLGSFGVRYWSASHKVSLFLKRLFSMKIPALMALFLMYSPYYFKMCQDLPHLFSHQYREITGYAAYITPSYKLKDDEQTFMIHEKAYYDIKKDVGIVEKGCLHTIYMLPHTGYIVKIVRLEGERKSEHELMFMKDP